VLSNWVKAKLALRSGNLSLAEALMHKVEAGNPQRSDMDEGVLERAYSPICMVRGQLAVIAIAQHRFTDALRLMQSQQFDAQTAYLAERVLTIEELQQEVERREREAGRRTAVSCETDEPREDPIREIYARRLMRLQRFDDALPYFSAPNRLLAAPYAALVQTSKASNDRFEIAQALFKASQMARSHGMEIMGTGAGPDWTLYEGSTARSALCEQPWQGNPPKRNADRDEPYHYFDADNSLEYPGNADDGSTCYLPTAADQKLISVEERQRLAATQPAWPQRFHYRFVASQLAEQAADLLPKRSQAFAATLCHAAKYVRYRSPLCEKWR
jgi:hypothetical protein